MKGFLLTIAITFLSLSHGDEGEFCSDRQQKDFVNKFLSTSESRLSFPNRGGPFDIGVCWWHSQFQRNAAYLSLFRPDYPAPEEREVKKIISALRHGRQVVTIDGYKNFYSFSRNHEELIQKELESWQMSDTFIKQKWIFGLTGKTEVSPEELDQSMDELYRYVKAGNVAYQKLQMPGIIAHSWLVIDIERTEDGHELRVIDGSRPLATNTYTHHKGDTYVQAPFIRSPFVPYTENKRELRLLKKAIKDFCTQAPSPKKSKEWGLNFYYY